MTETFHQSPMHRPTEITPESLGREVTLRGKTGRIIGGRKTKAGHKYLVVEFPDGKRKGVNGRRDDFPAPAWFNIRCKEYDFASAPDLTGRDDAAYVAAIHVNGGMEKGGRFGLAIEAAKEAARMCDAAIRTGRLNERAAYVGCEHSGERPPGAMKSFMYVSYRPRS